MKRLTNITTRCLTIFTMLLLATLTSCKKDLGTSTPDDGFNQSGDQAISFRLRDAFSKAPINDISDLAKEGNSFKVFGVFTGAEVGHVFDETGTPVNYSDGNWTYEDPRYWMNGSYDFSAVYPSNVNASYSSIDKVLTIADFEVTEDKQEDLLVAFNTGIDGSKGSANNPVTLNFRHLLTKINLKIQQDFTKKTGDPENDYLIKSVTIGGVKNSCTYVATPSAASERGYKDGWSFNNTTTVFEKVYETPVKLREHVDDQNVIQPLLVWDDALLQIPQEIVSETVYLRIVYIYRLNGDADGEKDRERTFETFIPATKDLWKSGNHIVYIISIANPSNIVLLPSKIEPWIDDQPGVTIIIN